MLWLALLLFAGAPTPTPMRWFSVQTSSLELLDDSPVNVLLLAPREITADFVREAARRRLAVFALVQPDDSAALAADAFEMGAAGLVVENVSGNAAVEDLRRAAAGRPFVELRERSQLSCDPGPDLIIGTSQGLWPGIRFDESGISAGPTSTPWIDTNNGFLRFLRSESDAQLWIANRVRAAGSRGDVKLAEYFRAIADAALGGGHWVVDLDADFQQALLRRDPKRLRDWRRMGELLRYFDAHSAWARYKPASELALVVDCSMASLSGGVLDMFSSRHIPVFLVTPTRIFELDFRTISAILNLTRAHVPGRRKVARFDPPEGWGFPASPGGAFVPSRDQSESLGFVFDLTRDGSLRANFGTRLFNGAGTLSGLVASPDGRTVVLMVVNYTDYPIEQVTVDFAGTCRRVRLWRPAQPPRDLLVESAQGRTRVVVDEMLSVACIEFTR